MTDIIFTASLITGGFFLLWLMDYLNWILKNTREKTNDEKTNKNIMKTFLCKEGNEKFLIKAESKKGVILLRDI